MKTRTRFLFPLAGWAAVIALPGAVPQLVAAKGAPAPLPTFFQTELLPAPEPLLVVFRPLSPSVNPSPKSRVASAEAIIPLYDWWVGVLRDEPRPKRANEFLFNIKRIFTEEGVPEELAWIPEIESTFNPRARNSNGARGLFQFMPDTAREQGLKLRPYDERIHPEKSARAAALLLRRLHEVFDSWPLALAAYNAGEGRVRRALESEGATTFAEIADVLPMETRLYVPRVFATLTVREGVAPSALGSLTQIQ